MDESVQALRRRVASGDASAEAPLLVARLRAGELTRERIELAAYCGHAGAIEVLGAEAAALLIAPVIARHARAIQERQARGEPQPSGLAPWIHCMQRWGKEPLQRAAVAAARAALEVWESAHRCNECGGHGLCPYARDGRECSACRGEGMGEEWSEFPRRRVDAAEQLLACPCRDHDSALSLLGNSPPTWSLLWSVFNVTLAGESAVRQAIAAALIAWALGER